MADSIETEAIEKLRRRLEMYELIFESIHNGAIVTDADGFITHFNTPYGQFLGLRPDAQIGRHCTEFVENTRMHIVAQTGKAEINQSHLIKGQNMVVQRIPIKQDGRVIAVFGQVMFKDVKDVGKLARELSLLESKVKLYEEELISLRSTRYTFDSIIGLERRDPLRKRRSPQGRRQQLPGAHHRRERHGQGTVCPGHSPRERPASVPLRAHQLCRHPARPARVRAVRLREGRLHGRQGRGQARQVRTGAPGHHIPR